MITAISSLQTLNPLLEVLKITFYPYRKYDIY